jgi:acyl carrier protein
MTMSHETKAAIVRRLILELLPPTADENPAIFGAGAPLDSLGLVNLLADLEYKIGEEFGREVVLASEQAMSRSRSPFRDVASLTDYIVELLHA